MSAVAGHGVSVNVQACGKTFVDGTRALAPATLDIARGETLVLLGPSGCGKTTMLRIIAGLELPDTGGKVLFDGRDVTSVPIEKRNVGMVFQSYALFPNLSVTDNIGYGLKIRGLAKQERASRVAELVALTNISGLENRRINQLSGGQRQRVALARAVALRPGILLLDVALTAPETIGIVDAASAPLCGTIDSVSFRGDRQRMIVSAASDKPLTADAPNTVQAKAGERVGLSIAPEAVRLLPLEG